MEAFPVLLKPFSLKKGFHLIINHKI